jgi:hypothetical protein
MFGRLLFGLLKGLVVGGLVGFALAKAGFIAPGAFIAYASAAATGVLVGLVAGKPIWAKDAKIEAGMKAVVGALVGAGLLWAVRRWLGGIPLPFSLGTLAEANRSLGETASNGTVGGLSLTSLPVVASVLGAFYDVDNTPEPEGDDKKSAAAAPASKARIGAGAKVTDELSDEEEEPAEKRQRR